MTAEQLKILVDTVQQLSLARDMNKVTEVVRKSARYLTGADGATFVLKDEDHCYYADEDAISPLWKGQRFPLTSCISGWAMMNHKAAISEDIYIDDRIPIEAYKPTFVKSLVMVPIRTENPLGAIGNYWAKLHKPTEEEILLLQSLADITSVSIENVYVYKELEKRVKQRTEQLETANKELESFSYYVSHDLRAPLRTITGYTRILNEDYGEKMGGEAKRLLGRINHRAIGMEKLIDDLLEFSRLGRKEVNKTQVDMNWLTRRVLTELNKSVPHHAKISIGKLPEVFADESLIYQVMLNLVSNALKYSSKKENPQIEIGASEKGDEIVFCVKDNGAGFDMQYAHKLFGVFQRLHSNEEFEGIGIGLGLVKQIISKHGGRVWAEGKVNEGASFYFSLKKG